MVFQLFFEDRSRQDEADGPASSDWSWEPLPQFFIPPFSGTAPNGKPIFDWAAAAAQLTRDGSSWASGLGQPVTVSYAFRSTAPTVMPSDTGGFTRFSSVQIAAAETVLRLWSDVANISFTRVGAGLSGEAAYSNSAAILFANYATGEAGAAAFAYLPTPGATNPSSLAGDVWLNVSVLDADYSRGSFTLHTLAHEIGHALGMEHPSEYNGTGATYDVNAAFWQDSRMYTIMSYFGSSNVGGSLNAFSSGPQLFDIAAVQRLYGPNMSTRTGDTVYGFNSNTGLDHFTIRSAADSPVFSIWDAGGSDTIDFSGFSTPSEIDLRELSFSSAGPGNGGVGVAVGNISIAKGVTIENGIGGAGADTMTGNDVANRLTGNGGADQMFGLGGLDTSVYASSSSGVRFSRDGAVWVVQSPTEGVDRLTGMEFAEFSDRTLALRAVDSAFDGNGTSDIVLRNAATGVVAVWTQNGATVTSASVIAVSDAAFSAAFKGDFDGNGATDLLFRGASGLLVQWQIQGAAVTGTGVYATDPTWSLAAIGDFDGDRRDDILFRSSGGLLAQWRMDGLAVSTAGVFAVSDPSWSLASLGDFNGDGREDLLWRNSSGLVALWSMDGFGSTNLGVFALSDPAWSIAGVGDFNGDLRDDILWRSAGGVVALWTMDGATVLDARAMAVSDPNWSVSDVGDYNGDGRDDLLWQGPDGTFALWAFDGFSVISTGLVGNPGSGWTDIV